MLNQSLLIVEDDVSVREALTQLLISENYKVTSVGSSREAISAFLAQPTDIVIVDVNLDSEDGWKLFEALKELREDLPIIVTSAEAHLLKHPSAGRATGLLEKPFDVPQLLSLLKQDRTPQPQPANSSTGSRVFAMASMLLAASLPLLAQAQSAVGTSEFRITNLQVREGLATLSWQGGGGSNQVQTRTDLNSPWRDLDAPTAESSLTHVVTEPQLFYRVVDVTATSALAADKKAPSTPTGLIATPASCNQINLSWNPSSDSGQNASGVSAYNVYRNGVLLKQVPTPSTTTSDTGLAGSTTYTYTVAAVDRARNTSPKSIPSGATTPACGGGGNIAPVAVAGPDQSIVAGSYISFSANGSYDPDGVIIGYQWDFGNGGTAAGSSVWNVYSSPGTYTVRLTVTDNFGVTSSDSAVVNVQSAADTTPPVITLASPQNGATVSGLTTLTASASDSSGINRVDYFYDGEIYLGSSGAAPYSVSWNTTAVPNGYHTVYARAYDNAGNSTTSAGATVNVSNFTAPSNPGQFLWVKTPATSLNDYAKGVATDASGNMILVGDLNGGLFIHKYSSNGDLLWQRQYGSSYGNGVATDSAGNIYVTGYFMGGIDLGNGWLTGLGAYGVTFVAKFGSDGTPQWSKAFVSSSDGAGQSIAVDASGNVFVTGYFGGAISFGGLALTSRSSTSVFVAKLSGANGSHLWSQAFGDVGGGQNVGSGVAVDSTGNAYVTGSFLGPINFGGGTLNSSGFDVFVAKFTSNGAHSWSKRFGSDSVDYGYTIATGPSGEVVVGGSFRGTIDFGNGPLVNGGSYSDGFAVKLSASNGSAMWSKQIAGGAGAIDSVRGVRIASNGDVLMTGGVSGAFSAGGGSIAANYNDAFIVRLGSGGNYIWGKAFGDYSVDQGNSVALDSSGNVVVAGNWTGNVNFGDGNRASVGGGDSFLLKLAP